MSRARLVGIAEPFEGYRRLFGELSGDPHVAPDLRHSAAEDRFIAVGRNARGRALFVAFIFRTREGESLVRPVSARYMHKKEVEAYETQGS